MPRPKKKPDYDAEQVLQDLIAAVLDSYNSPTAGEERKSLKLVAEELEITPLKVRKLLITTGEYKTSASMRMATLYVPLGYLLPFTWPKLLKNRQDRYSPWKVLLIGLVCSALTESTQLIFRIGLFEIDDMINNSLGCLLGWFLYLLIQRGNRTGEQK